MPAKIPLIGKRFSAWTVEAQVGLKCLCKCECGASKWVASQSLRLGRSTSCGCRRSGHGINGGISHTAEYRIWRGMIARCEYKNVKCYHRYGGRGIKVCSAWRTDFDAFLKDVGPRPSIGHSIDRIDPDGDYEPGNVRWAIGAEQVNNRRNTTFVVYRGNRMPLTEAVRAAGSIVHRECARVRIERCGWTVERAVETPAAVRA